MLCLENAVFSIDLDDNPNSGILYQTGGAPSVTGNPLINRASTNTANAKEAEADKAIVNR
jgi:hypothetical protein